MYRPFHHYITPSQALGLISLKECMFPWSVEDHVPRILFVVNRDLRRSGPLRRAKPYQSGQEQAAALEPIACISHAWLAQLRST